MRSTDLADPLVPSRRHRWAVAWAGAAAALAVAVLASCSTETGSAVAEGTTSTASSVAPAAPALSDSAEESTVSSEPLALPGLFDVSDLVKQVRPGVVSVTQEQMRLDLFGVPEEVPVGSGTGVVIDNEGLVLTNHHVIAGASQVLVIGEDGEEREAAVVAEASARDLALLQLDVRDGLSPLPFADPAEIEVGDPVIAIGNALGLDATDPTVSAGIVSALGRSVSSPAGTMQDLIQTDAAINPGNSGGPLLNARGEVVGINTAIVDRAQNVGFAISVDTAALFVERYRLGVGEPFLGVSMVDNTPAVAEQLELAADTGALIIEVTPGSAASMAGIEQFDVITRFGDVAIETADELTAAVLESVPGDMVEIEVVAGQESMTTEITIGERPEGT
jgi:S1-C subfamily serine protease